jgi:hypothetical protein
VSHDETYALPGWQVVTAATVKVGDRVDIEGCRYTVADMIALHGGHKRLIFEDGGTYCLGLSTVTYFPIGSARFPTQAFVSNAVVAALSAARTTNIADPRAMPRRSECGIARVARIGAGVARGGAPAAADRRLTVHAHVASGTPAAPGRRP